MNTSSFSDIKWAISALQAHRELYRRASRYYAGDHDLNFASERFLNAYGHQLRALKANICPTVIDTLSDRLQVTRFAVLAQGDAVQNNLTSGREEGLEKRAAEIWRRNRMDKQAGDIHKESLKTGDAYAIVWADERGKATIYPQSAGQVAVAYHPEIPGFIVKASKYWLMVDEMGARRIRLNVYYPDRIEKYISKSANVDGFLPYEAAAFEPIAEDPIVPNPYGKVPVFHFANNSEIGALGRGELEDIIPLQDSLNKIFADMMVASESNAYPQRVISGLDPADLSTDADGKVINPFNSSMDSVWLLANGDDAAPTYGSFETSDNAQFTQRINTLREQISISSGIPLHYLVAVNGAFPSGEALKTSEARLTAKVRDRQIAFGAVWSDVMRFCLAVEGLDNVDIETLWQNTEPRMETADLQNAVLKARDLSIPLTQIWAEMGYGAKEIAQFETKNADDAAARQKAFDSGLGAQLDR